MSRRADAAAAGLFDVDQHPDAAVAQEEIRRHYADRVDDARLALAQATDALAVADRALAAWDNRREITTGRDTDAHPEHLAMQVLALAGDAQNRYLAAARAAIDKPHDGALRAVALAAQQREEALLRWLTAQGYELGAMARPMPDKVARSRRSR